jgi:hypothetical protein
MSRASAKQIVARLLEYGIDPDAPRPGSPEDPWRQSLGPLPPMQFGGRPGPALDEPEEDPSIPKEIPVKPTAGNILRRSKPSRFNWKPPTEKPPPAGPPMESLLQELGGHYCFTCKSATSAKYDEKDKKTVCSKCGAELNYAKHGKNPAPKGEPKKE